MRIHITGVTASDRLLKKTGAMTGKRRTQKAREDPLLFQMSFSSLSINAVQMWRSFTTVRLHLTMMWGATRVGGFPHRAMSEGTAIDAGKGFKTRVMITGGGCPTLPRVWWGKDCHRGLRQITNRESRGWAGGRSRAEAQGGSETSVPLREQTTKEVEQVGREVGGVYRAPTETDKGRSHIKRGAPPLKGNGEKWMTPITLGKFQAKCIAALSKKEEFRGFSSLFSIEQNPSLSFVISYFPSNKTLI